jgi:hypothetical protein
MKKNGDFVEAFYFIGVPLVQFLNRLAFLRVFFQGLEEAFGMDAMA